MQWWRLYLRSHILIVNKSSGFCAPKKSPLQRKTNKQTNKHSCHLAAGRIFNKRVACQSESTVYALLQRFFTRLYPGSSVSTELRPSRWCLAKPVAARGYTLSGLAANTCLVALSVRAKNEIGWSDPSDTVDEVFTEGTAILVDPQGQGNARKDF